ncbi:hypothetical protein GN277_05180 [Lachnospiraceae bacterium WCA-9-b2]|uniref:Glycosyltransferase n=1 Tax=Sporofaciens musculi TaxID=2681861 RepID=A0A7X3MEC0_9FIRM|nr:hypothetical protein [Sporofaciens musculi]MXP74793.1 hypothetical protein [Sporofaciens musculi]
MSKLFLLFNCPSGQNDKQWLEDVLRERGYDFEIIETKLYVNVMCQDGVRGKMRYYYRILTHAFKAILKSKENDIIISWSDFTAGFINFMSMTLGNRRKIISMNWLTPRDKKSYWEYLDRKQFQNKNVLITVNALDSKQKYLEKFHLASGDNIYYIPDIYDTTVDFVEPCYKKNGGRYIFTGGMANRDWGLVMQIAIRFPTLSFVCCALEHDFKSKVDDVPENVKVYYSISPDEYYLLMAGAYLVLMPLITYRVSGLINITRSAQSGVPCLVSRYDFTQMYYPEELGSWVVDGSDVEKWGQEVERALEYAQERYISNVKMFQNHIIRHFGPKVAFETLEKMISTLL